MTITDKLREFVTSEDYSIERMAATAPFPVLGDIVMYKELRKNESRVAAAAMTIGTFMVRASVYTSIALTAMEYYR